MARKKAKVDGPVYYTTFQVSKFLGVSLPTVVNWVNSGLLPAHRTPGGHRRIGRNDIIAFARQQEYPLSHEFLADGREVGRVLVVDDEEDFAEMVREYLQVRGGLEVEWADSGFQAGMTVARFKPDLILMDLMMPGMDGFQVCRMLRDDPDTRHVPVIACTAFGDAGIDRRIRDEGFDGYVDKPVKLEALLALVRERLAVGEHER
jgi:excisionase family DNA binding protein